MDAELTAAQFDALIGAGDRQVLVALLHEWIDRWPWWDRRWRIAAVGEVRVQRINGTIQEVDISGIVARGGEERLPLAVFVRVAGDRVDRFQVRAGDAVIGPPIRHGEPHPFGTILAALMERRGISLAVMAQRCGLAKSTIAKMRAGYLVPDDPIWLADMAATLDMPVGDLRAIAGLPPA